MSDDATTQDTTRAQTARGQREKAALIELTAPQVERVLGTLTDAQVARVVLRAAVGQQPSRPLLTIDSLDVLRRAVLPLLDDKTYSYSTFRAVMVLAALPADGSERELTAIARTIGLSPSTTHRYIRTWAALGVLEQNPDSQRYRRAHSDDVDS